MLDKEDRLRLAAIKDTLEHFKEDHDLTFETFLWLADIANNLYYETLDMQEIIKQLHLEIAQLKGEA